MGSFRPFTDLWGWKHIGLSMFERIMEIDRRREAALKGWRTRRHNQKKRNRGQ